MRFKAIAWDCDDTLWWWHETKSRSFLYEGIGEVLKKIPKENQGIITNGQGSFQRTQLKDKGILKYFNPNLFFASWDEARKLKGDIHDNLWDVQKPQEYMFVKFLEKAQCTPNECVMIGDSCADIIGANSIGFKSVLIDGVWKKGSFNSAFYKDGTYLPGAKPDYIIPKENISKLNEILFK